MIKVTVKKIANPTKLSVFDFDGVLFNSPEKPSGHQGNWWIEKVSLAPETIGDPPDDHFWNNQIISLAKKECSDPNIYCILLTGRIGNTFSERILQLIKQKNINFKKIGFNTFGQDSADFKINYINDLLKKMTSIKNIEMWEDQKDKAELYTDTYSKKYNFKCNLIEE